MRLTIAGTGWLLILAVSLTSPLCAHAAPPIIVGNGTAASCTEAALKQALLVAETIGGGTVQFKCGRQPASIALSGITEVDEMLVLLVLPNNTTIDGGGLITLNGTSTGTAVFVDSGTTAVLKGLTITNGIAADFSFFNAGGIVNFGTLTITKSTVSENVAFSCCVGGIWNIGTLTIDHSEISSNHTHIGPGGGILNQGKLRIRDTLFADNTNFDSGAGIANSGALEITNSSFLGNVTMDGFGGAISNGGKLMVKGSLFAKNLSARLTGGGGAIQNSGTLDVQHSTFSQNETFIGGDGGAISSSGALTVKDSTFSSNAASSGGGIYVEAGSSASIDGSTLSDNSAGLGGGIFTAGALDIKKSTVTQNTAFAGGGIYVCVEQLCAGTLKLKHTSVSGNTPDDIFP